MKKIKKKVEDQPKTTMRMDSDTIGPLPKDCVSSVSPAAPMEPESSCVFCCKSVKSYGNSHEKGGTLLEKEVKIMFVVHKLLGVDRSVTEGLLQKFGNPSNWIRICWTCEELVNESKSIYNRIQHLAKSLHELKDAAEKKVKESEAEVEGKKKNSKRIGGAAGTLRRVVLKRVPLDPPGLKSELPAAVLQNECDFESVKREFVPETEHVEEGFIFDHGEAMAVDEDDYGINYSPLPDDGGADDNAEPGGISEAVAATGVRDDEEWTPDSLLGKPRQSSRSRGMMCPKLSKADQLIKRKKSKRSPKKAKDADARMFGKSGRLVYPFNCQLCKYTYPTKFNLLKHYRLVHDHFTDEMKPSAEGYACGLCDLTAANPTDLNSHKLSEHSDQILKCPHCPKIFKRTETSKLEIHVSYYHEEGKRDKEREGENENEGDAEGNEIDEQNVGGVYKCSLCEYETPYRRAFIRHREHVHWTFHNSLRGKRLRKCMSCAKKFNDDISYRNHCLKDHKMLKCHMCPALFSNIALLKKHISTFHDRSEDSTLEVISSEKLGNPVKNEYNVDCDDDDNSDEGEREDVSDLVGSYKCDQCDLVKKSKDELDYHVRVKHWIVPRIPKRTTVTNIDCKCTVCNENFRGGDALKRHCLDIHKMYECVPCNRLFVSKLKLELHDKANDIKHKMSLASKPNKCNFCPKRFLKLHQLNFHLKQCHPNQARSSKSQTINISSKIENEVDEASRSLKTKKPLKIFQCPYCLMRANKKGKLKEHMGKTHYEISCRDKMEKGEEVTLKCDKCALTSFQSVDELLQHKEEEHKMAKCETCLHCLPSQGFLHRHWQCYHSEESIAKWEDSSSKIRQRKIQSSSVITCVECEIEFDDKNDLFEHNLKEHPDKLYKCDDCPETETQRYDTLAKLYTHKILIHNEPSDPYRCKLCDYTSKHYFRLESHKVAVHFPRPKLVCEKCSKQYASEKLLQWHKMKEHGIGKDKKLEVLSCMHCHKVFSSPNYLRIHTRMVHMNQSHYICPYENCSRGFNGQKLLDLHIRLRHKKREGFIPCPFKDCKTDCGTKAALDKHIKGCHSSAEKFKCEHCSYETLDLKLLGRHTAEVHENKETRPYQCDYCGKGFSSFRYLRQHFNSHIRAGQMDRSEVPKYREYKSKLEFMSLHDEEENNSNDKE